jgi:hypothetical protein
VGEGFVSVVGHARDLIIEGLAARFPAFDGDTVPLSERQRERGREREREREGGRERGRESERVRDRGGQRERERERGSCRWWGMRATSS